jgi:hypothetical protein
MVNAMLREIPTSGKWQPEQNPPDQIQIHHINDNRFEPVPIICVLEIVEESFMHYHSIPEYCVLCLGCARSCPEPTQTGLSNYDYVHLYLKRKRFPREGFGGMMWDVTPTPQQLHFVFCMSLFLPSMHQTNNEQLCSTSLYRSTTSIDCFNVLHPISRIAGAA